MQAGVGVRQASSSESINNRDVQPKSATTPENTASSWGRRHPLSAGFAASSVSVASGVLLTHWVDVIKVRQQLAGAESRNLVATGVGVVQKEGFIALMHGLSPAVVRGLLYGGLRIGLYMPFKEALSTQDADAGVARKIAAGMASGAVAAAVCNPTDLVKTRMQAGGALRQGPIAVALAVVREEGWRALWKGTSPSMARAALLTAAQCATYDEIKLLFVRRLGWSDSVGTHLTVSTLAGLVTTSVTAPADLIKTHMFVGRQAHVGPWQCMADIYRRQGVRGLFSGWTANYLRQGPLTTVIFVVNEAIRPALGLESL